MSPLDSLDFCRRLCWPQANPCAIWGAECPDTLGWSEKKMEGRFRKHLEEYSPLLQLSPHTWGRIFPVLMWCLFSVRTTSTCLEFLTWSGFSAVCHGTVWHLLLEWWMVKWCRLIFLINNSVFYWDSIWTIHLLKCNITLKIVCMHQ